MPHGRADDSGVPSDSSTSFAHGVQDALNRLIRAVGRDAHCDAYRAYRDLYGFGADAIPAIADYVRQNSWTEVKARFQLAVFDTLVGLIHDIDEVRSWDVVNECLSPQAHRLYRMRWETIRQFTVADYHRVAIRNVAIFISKKLRDHSRKIECLDEWLGNIPPDDFAGIERLYVVPWEIEDDTLGHYTPLLYNITIMWYEFPDLSGLIARPVEMAVESTLYHEIGHHVHRHGFGQDPEQEREADAYATRVLFAAHPRFYAFARVINWITPRAVRRKLCGF